jgi:hypothetical protein
MQVCSYSFGYWILVIIWILDIGIWDFYPHV